MPIIYATSTPSSGKTAITPFNILLTINSDGVDLYQSHMTQFSSIFHTLSLKYYKSTILSTSHRPRPQVLPLWRQQYYWSQRNYRDQRRSNGRRFRLEIVRIPDNRRAPICIYRHVSQFCSLFPARNPIRSSNIRDQNSAV